MIQCKWRKTKVEKGDGCMRNLYASCTNPDVVGHNVDGARIHSSFVCESCDSRPWIKLNEEGIYELI